jgi:hypothetical protein
LLRTTQCYATHDCICTILLKMSQSRLTSLICLSKIVLSFQDCTVFSRLHQSARLYLENPKYIWKIQNIFRKSIYIFLIQKQVWTCLIKYLNMSEHVWTCQIKYQLSICLIMCDQLSAEILPTLIKVSDRV